MAKVAAALRVAINKERSRSFSQKDTTPCTPYEGLIRWIRSYLFDTTKQKGLSRPTIEDNLEDLTGGDEDGPFPDAWKGNKFVVKVAPDKVVVVMETPEGRRRRA